MGITISETIASWPKWPSLNESHPDFLDFLHSNKLLYCMRGFEHTSELAEPSTAFQTDHDEHPMIQIEGEWTRWEQLKDLGLYYEDSSRLLLDKDGTEWNYLPALGLTKRKRYNNVYSICRLSAAAMQALDNSVTKKPKERGNHNYIQLITDGTSPASRTDHVAIRLIHRTGEVYSLGFETVTPLEFGCSQIPNLLATQNVQISSQDFREFKKFIKRPTTTISLSDEQFQAALTRVHELSAMPLRFNLIGANCVSFAAELLHAAGVEVNVHQYPLEAGYDLLPNIENLPYFGSLLSGVKNCTSSAFNRLYACVPSPVETTFAWTAHLIMYAPLKVSTVLRNTLLLLPLGASRQLEVAINPDDHSLREKRLGNFSSLMPCWWKDIWRDDVGLIASPLKLIDWQDRKMKDYTFVHRYDGSPKLYI